MPAALILVQYLLPLLPTIETGVEHLVAFIFATRTAAKQSSQWTPELEAAFKQSLLADAKDPAQQPDFTI